MDIGKVQKATQQTLDDAAAKAKGALNNAAVEAEGAVEVSPWVPTFDRISLW
jgi:hypothetical protein